MEVSNVPLPPEAYQLLQPVMINHDATTPVPSPDQQLEISPLANTSYSFREVEAVSQNRHGLHELKTVWEDTKVVARYCQKHQRFFWTHFGLFILSSSVLGSSIAFAVLNSIPYFLGSRLQYCVPGGNFDVNGRYNLWSSEHTFQITLGFGNMTFAQAKAIDVVWDVTVGRGGQFLLGAVSFCVFSKSLNRMLELPNSSCSYDAFRAIVFERPTLSSTWKLIRDLTSVSGWRAKTSLVWIVISSLYVVAFPTMVSAMTGYSAIVAPYFSNGASKIPLSDDKAYFHRAIYRVYGANRIQGLNLTPTYLVGSRGFGTNDYPDDEYWWCANGAQYGFSGWNDRDDCYLAHAVANYLTSYNATNSENVTSNLEFRDWRNKTLYNVSVSAPTLRIDVLNTNYSDKNVLPNAVFGISNAYLYTTKDGNETHTAEWFNSLGTCDSQTTYQWGFSYILLFGFLLVTAIWELGMYVMWNDAFWNCRLDRAGRTMGFYRGVVDISDAMQKDTLRDPWKLASESQIRDLLAKERNGGRVMLDEINVHELGPPRIEDLAQFKQSIALLRYWTKTLTNPRTVMYWAWLGISLGCCFAWSLFPLASMIEGLTMSRIAAVINLTIVSLCWSTAAVMLLVGLTALTRWWHRIPFLGTRVKPRTKKYWIWMSAFCVLGALAFMNAICSYWYVREYLFQFNYPTQFRMWFSMFLINFIFAGIFGLIVGVLLLIGLFSTIWRWSLQLVKAVWGLRQHI